MVKSSRVRPWESSRRAAEVRRRAVLLSGLGLPLGLLAAILGEPPSWVTKLIGTISGPRAVTVERTYIRAWFGTYLGHHGGRLLAGPSPRFPEVEFVR